MTASGRVGSRQISSLGQHGEPIVHSLANRNRVHQLRADRAVQGSGPAALEPTKPGAATNQIAAISPSFTVMMMMPARISPWRSTALASTGKCWTSDECLWALQPSADFDSFLILHTNCDTRGPCFPTEIDATVNKRSGCIHQLSAIWAMGSCRPVVSSSTVHMPQPLA